MHFLPQLMSGQHHSASLTWDSSACVAARSRADASWPEAAACSRSCMQAASPSCCCLLVLSACILPGLLLALGSSWTVTPFRPLQAVGDTSKSSKAHIQRKSMQHPQMAWVHTRTVREGGGRVCVRVRAPVRASDCGFHDKCTRRLSVTHSQGTISMVSSELMQGCQVKLHGLPT